MHNELPSYSTPPAGAIRFNTDSNKLEVYRGGVGIGTTNQTGGWWQIDNWSPENQTGGTRGVYGGGQSGPALTDYIEYINVDTTGNATDFGNLDTICEGINAVSDRTRLIFIGGSESPGPNTRLQYITMSSTGDTTTFSETLPVQFALAGTTSNSTRGVVGGGSGGQNVIQYLTIQSDGKTNDFGDLTSGYEPSGLTAFASATRGVFAGGYDPTPTPAASQNVMNFITIATTGNASDFGDLTQTRHFVGGCSNSVRGIISAGQQGASVINTIDYVTISTLGNAIDFGDNTQSKFGYCGLASKTRAAFVGGSAPGINNTIDYVQIMTTGNAIDFGDMNQTGGARYIGGSTNGHGGL